MSILRQRVEKKKQELLKGKIKMSLGEYFDIQVKLREFELECKENLLVGNTFIDRVSE